MKNLIICICMFYPVSKLLAQDKHNFSVEFNVNRANYKMESLNSLLSDTNTFSSLLFGKNLKGEIKNGADYNFIVSYQPLGFIEFGVFVNYRYASIKRGSSFFFGEPPYSQYEVRGTYCMQIDALSTGFSSHLHINKLAHLERSTSKMLNKLQLSVGLMGGLGFSTLNNRESSHIVGTNPYNASKDNSYQYRSTDFQGKVELSAGYRIGKKMFSDIGVKVGYQFFKTSSMKDSQGNYFYSNTIDGEKKLHNIDFSGIYYGVYIKIGK